MKVREPNKSLSLKELRDVISDHKEKGRKLVAELNKIRAHAAKMEEYYSAWEDELALIHNMIVKASAEHGITQDKVEEYDALEDVFGE